MAKYQELHRSVVEVFRPKAEPIGFRMLTKEEYDRISARVKPFEHQVALCQALKIAAVLKRTLLLNPDNVDACVVGTYVLGLREPPPDLEKRWVEGFAYTPELFKKLVEAVHALPMGRYAGAIVAPLERFDELGLEPDGVIIVANSVQSYMLLVGYFDATGHKPSSDFNGHAACEIFAAVALGKSPWLTIPCGGARALAEAQDDELWLGFKPDQLQKAVDRMKKVGLVYPPPIFQRLLQPPLKGHPLTYLIARSP